MKTTAKQLSGGKAFRECSDTNFNNFNNFFQRAGAQVEPPQPQPTTGFAANARLSALEPP
jgi:hypothetical protein